MSDVQQVRVRGTRVMAGSKQEPIGEEYAASGTEGGIICGSFGKHIGLRLLPHASVYRNGSRITMFR